VFTQVSLDYNINATQTAMPPT